MPILTPTSDQPERLFVVGGIVLTVFAYVATGAAIGSWKLLNVTMGLCLLVQFLDLYRISQLAMAHVARRRLALASLADPLAAIAFTVALLQAPEGMLIGVIFALPSLIYGWLLSGSS